LLGLLRFFALLLAAVGDDFRTLLRDSPQISILIRADWFIASDRVATSLANE
jgi:hypothetical protein